MALGALLALAEAKPVILRPYQQQMVQAWQAAKDRGVQRGLIVAATGTGKTTVFGAITGAQCEEDPEFSALILAHREELLRQAAFRFQGMYPSVGIGIESGSSSCAAGARVVCGSVLKLGMPGSESLSWLRPNEVVCDEGHHGAARSYQSVFRRFGCYQTRGTSLLGVTATPHRLDQLALYGSDEAIFQEVVFTFDIVAAIREGFLVAPRGYRAAADIDLSKVRKSGGDYNQGDLEKTVNVDAVNELAFASWEQVASDRQTIAFCSGVDHAKRMAQIYTEQGIKAEAVYGDMPMPLRDAAIARFRRGDTQVLTNCDILTEGFDAQECACVVLLRPTTSWSLFTQMVGRGLRTLPGVIEGLGEPVQRRDAIKDSAKPDCVIIDIVANTSLHSINEKPESEDIPSLQALVGLPSTLDLQGRSIADAIAAFERLPGLVKSAAFCRPTTFEGLTSVLTQVEMVAELKLPDEAIQAGSQLFWLKIGDLTYIIDAGSDGHGIRRQATLHGDILGHWALRLESWEGPRQIRNETKPMPDNLNIAFKAAERAIQGSFFGVAKMAHVDAAWRQGKPSDLQVKLLQEAGIHREVIETMDKGKASATLSMLKAKGL